MSDTSTTVLRCDRPGCRASLAQEPRETILELRIRAVRDHGWRHRSHEGVKPWSDYCEVHA